MAASRSNHANSIQLSYGKLSDKKEVIICDCSEKTKLELDDVKLELSFLGEIIKVLQE